jgi:asparagine synthase (glutamine-hydrolysing)
VTSGLRGGAPDEIARALSDGNALSGLNAYAGQMPDGRLVRDALGREPLFVDGAEWARSAASLPDPAPCPPGSVGRPDERPRPVLAMPPSDPVDRDAALVQLRAAVEEALRGIPESTPVGLSGGLDSSLIAAHTAGPCYVVGLDDAPDVNTARDAANRLGRDLRAVTLTFEELRESVPTVAKAAGTVNPIDVAIALGLYHLGTVVKADGSDTLALGQGADELFGGYEKVAEAATDDRLSATTIIGARDEMIETIPRQAARDVQVLRAAGIEPIMPYLDDAVVSAALHLPEDLLVSHGVRKAGLRRVAEGSVPTSVVERDKQALQYGSRISRELDRMARQAGYKRRESDHIRRYIENRVAER